MGITGRSRGVFLRGPIPWAWLCRASALPGETLAVAMALWLEVGFQAGDRHVRLSAERLRQLGVTRFSMYRALMRLEDEGLVIVDRGKGRGPRVFLVRAESDNVALPRPCAARATPPIRKASEEPVEGGHATVGHVSRQETSNTRRHSPGMRSSRSAFRK